ncbi:MAG: acyltransferase [Thermodesulfovibrionales bacterium]|nr:acyltransferase [Thermodesulfovibrionales bacterium]
MLKKIIVSLFKEKLPEINNLQQLPDDVFYEYILERGIMLLRGFFRFGRFCFIGKNVCVKCKKRIKLGKFATIHDGSYIDASSQKGIIIEDYCTLGRNTYLRTGNVSSYQGYFIMRTRSSCNNNCFLGATGGLEIGENVLIGPNVTIITEKHNYEDIDAVIKEQGILQIPVTIENNVWIGANVVVLGGVVIKEGAIIGAGSIINKSVNSKEIVAGNPARLIKKRDEGTPDS